jgi:hypothetical protein
MSPQVHFGLRMFRPTLSQKARIPASSESRDVDTCPPLAEITGPVDGYKLMSRATASPGMEKLYAF